MFDVKKTTALILGLVLVFYLAGCSGNLTDKKRIVSLYRKNEAVFAAAVESGDYAEVRKLRGIREVTVRGDAGEVEFYCGGTGLVPGSSYYGILYVANGEAVFSQLVDASPEWFAEGNEIRYKQSSGDNDFRYEPLGNGFYYYEEHY